MGTTVTRENLLIAPSVLIIFPFPFIAYAYNTVCQLHRELHFMTNRITAISIHHFRTITVCGMFG